MKMNPEEMSYDEVISMYQRDKNFRDQIKRNFLFVRKNIPIVLKDSRSSYKEVYLNSSDDAEFILKLKKNNMVKFAESLKNLHFDPDWEREYCEKHKCNHGDLNNQFIKNLVEKNSVGFQLTPLLEDLLYLKEDSGYIEYIMK